MAATRTRRPARRSTRSGGMRFSTKALLVLLAIVFLGQTGGLVGAALAPLTLVSAQILGLVIAAVGLRYTARRKGLLR